MHTSVSESDIRPIRIGWREFAHFPEWGVRWVRAKTDTGARTSAIDVADIQELPGGRARFTLVGNRKAHRRWRTLEAPIVRRTRVKSSTGQPEARLVVVTSIRLGPVTKQAELTLVCRKHMLCRMLIGRSMLEGDFLVDVSERYLLGERPKRRRR